MTYEYCPNGNYWMDVTGFADKYKYMFCDCIKCNGAVYELRPINITKKVRNEKIQGFRNRRIRESVRDMVNIDNMDAVKDFINNLQR